MKRVMVVPLAVGFMCLLIAVLNGGTTDFTTSDTHNGNISIENSTTGDYQVESAEFDIVSADGIIILLMVGLTVGAVAGITILGSGLSELSQSTIFVSVIYIGLWAIMSLGMYELVQGIPLFGGIIWIVLTGMYLLGVSEIVTNLG